MALIIGAFEGVAATSRFCRHTHVHNPLEYRDGITLEGMPERQSRKVLFLPVYSSMNLGAFGPARPSVTSMMIFIHTHGRRAEAAFCNGLFGVRSNGLDNQILVITPYFGVAQHPWCAWTHSCGNHNSSERRTSSRRRLRSVSWSTESWLSGGNSDDDYTTSFGVLDQLAEIFLSGAFRHKHLQRRFPNLKSVSFCGFSAAGQLTSRHAFFSRLGYRHGSKHVRWFVSDSASYLYLTPERPAPECSALRDTGVMHMCQRFAVPNESGCSTYNRFKYGLSNLSDIDDNMYLQRYVEAPDLLDDAAVRFFERDVHFTFGGRDACNCRVEGYQNNKSQVCYPVENSCDRHQGPTVGGYWRGNSCCDSWPDALHDNVLVNQCEDMLQGSNRLQRGLNYKSHLERTAQQLRARGKKVRIEHAYDFFDSGHDVVAMLASDAFRKWLLACIPAEEDNREFSYIPGLRFFEAGQLQILSAIAVGCAMLIVRKVGQLRLARSTGVLLVQPLMTQE